MNLTFVIIGDKITHIKQAYFTINYYEIRNNLIYRRNIMVKPFVKLFKTPNAYYCLDVNRNEFIQIEQCSFEYLQKVLSGSADCGKEPKEIVDLKADDYLQEDSVVKAIRHPATNFLEYYLGRRILKITLQVTQNCNLRCKYCVYSETINKRQRSHSNRNMDFNTAKKAIDFLWEHSADSSSLDIGFYGGEPLIAIDLIKKVIDYSEKLFVGKEIGFTITTNATLLSEDIIHYFKEHNVKLMISLDGPKDINDENRVFRNGNGSYDIVMKNIKLIYKVEPEYAKKLQISMVLNPEHDFECFNRLYEEDEMFKQLSTISSIVDKDYDDVAAEISEEYLWKARYQNFLVLLSYLGRIHKDKLSPIVSMSKFSDIERRLDIPMGNRLFPVDTAGGSCIPGQIRLFCTVDGNLLPCERVSESSNACRIGTLEEGFDINKAKEFLNIGKLTEDVCRKCWCIRFCSMCGKMADSGKDTLDLEHKLKLCKNEHAAAEDKIKLYLLIKEINQYHVNNSCLKGDN